MRLFKNRDTAAIFLVMEGIVYTIAFNLYNPFIQMFAKRMGGGDIHTALLNAAPPLVAIFALIPCGILIERINRKKQTVLVLLSIISAFFAAIAFVPMLPGKAKVLVFVILIGMMNFPGSLYLTTWQSFFADNFRGSYASNVYTARSKYSTFFGLITTLAAGIMLTDIPKSDGERIFLYRLFYVACFALTLMQLFFFSRVKGRRMRNGSKTAIDPSDLKRIGIFSKEDFARMFKNKPFIVFCLCGLAFHFTWQMAWPLFFIYNTDYAHLNEFQLSIINVVSGLAQFLSFTSWNKLIDKKGSNLVIIFGTAGLAITPLVYSAMIGFTTIVILNILSGLSLGAFNLALFLNLLETLPKEKKTVYISVFNTITNITGFIAPLVGVWVYNQTNIYFAMLLTGIMRFAATALYFLRWRKAKAGGIAVSSESSQSSA